MLDSDKLLSSTVRCLGFLAAGLSPWDCTHFAHTSGTNEEYSIALLLIAYSSRYCIVVDSASAAPTARAC